MAARGAQQRRRRPAPREAHGLAVAALLVGGAAVAAEFQYAAGLRTDVRLRSALPGDLVKAPDGGAAAATGELELLPTVSGTLGLGPTRWNLLYNPSVLYREPEVSGPVVVLHRGRAQVEARWEGGVLTLSEDGVYGETDLNPLRSPLGSTGTAAGSVSSAVQTIAIIPYARSVSTASLDLTLPSRVGLSLSVGYQLGGSLVASDGGVFDPPLPYQRGPTGSLRLRYAPTSQDVLAVSAQAMEAAFVTGEEQLIAQATASWDRQLSRTVGLSLAGGVAYARRHLCTILTLPADAGIPPKRYCELPTPAPQGWDTSLPTPGWYAMVLPVASVGAAWRAPTETGAPFVGSTQLRVAPYADYVTGAVYERLEARLQGDWAISRELALRLIGTGSYALDVQNAAGQGGDQLYSGEGLLTWSPEPWFSFLASARLVWVAQPRLGVPGRLDWATTLSAVLHVDGTRAR